MHCAPTTDLQGTTKGLPAREVNSRSAGREGQVSSGLRSLVTVFTTAELRQVPNLMQTIIQPASKYPHLPLPLTFFFSYSVTGIKY
jgi:hypothetical protein